MGLGDPDLGEQALSKAAEAGITQQLGEVEQVNVDIRTDPLKLIQGKVDSVSVSGEGLVMKNSLRMEKLQVDTGAVAINPASAIFGKIELTKSAEADAHVTLTQEDVNQAFNSDYIRDKMQNLTISPDGEPIAIEVQQVDIQFLDGGKVHLKATVLMGETQEAQEVEAIVIPSVKEQGQRVVFEEVSGTDGGASSQLTQMILQEIMTLADLRNFELSGMSLVINDLEVQPGQMILKATTVIEKIPQV
jgi:LmeA-like phospholipid-binding